MPARGRPLSGAVPRVLGVVLGAGFGFLVMQVLGATIDIRFLLAVPGIGLALGCGLFSTRRRIGWGITCLLLAPAWVISSIWFQHPTDWSLLSAAEFLATTVWGVANLVVAAVAGFILGAGWRPK